MSKRKKGETSFSTNGKRQFVDPFTDEPLLPIHELEKAAEKVLQKGPISILPQDKKHWIPATVVRGCAAVRVRSMTHFQKLVETCQRLYEEQPDRKWDLPEDHEHSQPAGKYKTTEVLGEYRSGGFINFHFDPRMAMNIREEMGLPPYLKEDKSHWISTSMSEGCMAVNVDTKAPFAKLLFEACKRLYEEQPAREWDLPENHEHSQPAGKYKTTEVIGKYQAGGYTNFRFDPRMAMNIRTEMGLPILLPDEKKHWISASTEGCSKIGVERKKSYYTALKSICKRLVDNPSLEVDLSEDKENSQPAGRYKIKDTIRLCTNKGQNPTYYFDPRLIDAGFITKQLIKEEAAKIDSGIIDREALLEHLKRLKTNSLPQKTSPAEKIGDMDESKLPGNVREQLDQKREKQREK